jgi:hypothetical protein
MRKGALAARWIPSLLFITTAVILVTDAGGSGTFYDLALINYLSIQENSVVVDMMTQGPAYTRRQNNTLVWSMPSIGLSVGILAPMRRAKVGKKSMVENIAIGANNMGQTFMVCLIFVLLRPLFSPAE